MQANRLISVTERLEERDTRSKWDWAVLGVAMLVAAGLAAAMIVAAGLAGGGAFFYAKANIKESSFNQAIQRIAQDDDAEWCELANGHIVKGKNNTYGCAIVMQKYQGLEESAEE